MILGDPVATDSAELRQKAEALQSESCNGRYRYLDSPTSVADFVGETIKDIRVVRFARTRTSPTNEELRDSVREVWQGEFRSAACQINWAEF